MPAPPALPRVSVIVTTFDYGRYVGEAIESVLAQDYPQDLIEIVVVDDGSTDDTPAVLAGFGDRITAVRQENAGVNAATTLGLSLVTGDVIALLDADDAWLPGKLRAQVAVLEARPEVGMVTSDMEVVDGDGAVTHPSYFAAHRVRPPSGAVLGTFLARNLAPGSTIVFRAAFADRLVPFAAEAPFQDWWVAVKLAQAADVVWLDAPLVRYRVHGASLTNNGGARDLFNARRDTGFRRWMLRSLDVGEVGVAELAAAFATFDASAVGVVRLSGRPVRSEVVVTASDLRCAAPARDEARSALARRDLETAGRALVRALAADPFDLAARAALAAVQRPVPEPRGLLDGVRGFVGLATLAELRATPRLLRAWTAAFDAGSDATLVVLAGDDAPGLDWLGAQLAGDAPDVLALPIDDLSLVAGDATAILSDAVEAHGHALPVVGAHDAPDDIRALASVVVLS